MVPSHKTVRQQKYIVKGGAVLFAPGENGEIILTGAIATDQPNARYTLLGRSLSAAPDAVEVKLSLRRTSLRDGQRRGCGMTTTGFRT